MGCDIHLYAEVKKNNKWEFVAGDFYDGRNYELFAVLADVRNWYDIKPISQPKGFPASSSKEVKKKYKEWDSDAHSASFYTLSELLSYNWSSETSHEAFVDEPTYLTWDKTSGEGPFPRSRGVMGQNVVTFREEDYLRLKTEASLPEGKSIYVEISWVETTGVSCRDFVKNTIPKLKELESDPENVRIVFWFDN